MEEKKIRIKGYTIRIKYWQGRIIGMECNCMHGSIHRNNWWKGLTICKHIKAAVKIAKGENERRQGKSKIN